MKHKGRKEGEGHKESYKSSVPFASLVPFVFQALVAVRVGVA